MTTRNLQKLQLTLVAQLIILADTITSITYTIRH